MFANWANGKHTECNKNNYIRLKILSHPYNLIDRSILCNV